MEKIKKGSHDGVFDWILESDRNATHPENNSNMIRVLVQEHNKVVDAYSELMETHKRALNEEWNDGYSKAMEEKEQDRKGNS